MITITPEGVVSKDGKEIGVIKDGVCTSSKAIAPTVKADIKRAAGVPLKFEVTAAEKAPKAPKALAVTVNTPPKEEESVEMIPGSDIPRNFCTCGDALNKDLVHCSEGPCLPLSKFSDPPLSRDNAPSVPPAPPTHPALGDKTPAYVEWFRQHHSKEEYEAKYHPRRKLPDSIRAFEIGAAKGRKLATEKNDDE